MPRTRGGVLLRALVAAFLVIGFAAGAVATAGLLEVKTLGRILHQHSVRIRHLTPQKPGKPETILLIGSDHRAGAGSAASYANSNTDTMLLVRLDDSSDTVNLLSIPRDLEVDGPDGTPVKLNSIYSSEGGPSGLLKQLTAQVFPHLQVNHVIDTSFVGFSDLIDAIGCVYTDVDHRYYNVSEPAPSADNYSSIDIQPGYQRLCGGVYSNRGAGALAFVRFRHTDSDETRNARQQDFIRWAKDGYSSNQLLSNKDKLFNIFGKHTTTDSTLGNTNDLVDLFSLVVGANKLSLKTIAFPEYFGACTSGSQTPCYVYPCPELSTCTGYGGPNPTIGEPTQATEAAWNEFITPTRAAASAKRRVAAAAPPTTTTPTQKQRHVKPPKVDVNGLTADPGDGRSQAGQLGNVGLPIYYPRYYVTGQLGVTAGFCFSIIGNCDNPDEDASAYRHSYPRRYEIFGPGRTPYRSYVMTLVLNSGLGEYYTVQGTTWKNPPILNHVSEVRHVNGRELDEYDDGGKISLVAFHTATGTYWVTNTLANTIGKTEMIAMAAEMTRYAGKA